MLLMLLCTVILCWAVGYSGVARRDLPAVVAGYVALNGASLLYCCVQSNSIHLKR